jgi:glycosyltransferase involved in cell wall biosynthesis
MKLSVCMIMKNEEAVLKQSLESICAYVDDIIVVDTGSTDRTKEIALAFTQRVYDFSWCDDFSAVGIIL